MVMFTALGPVVMRSEYKPCGTCHGDPNNCPFLYECCPLSTATFSVWYEKQPVAADTFTVTVKWPSDAMRKEDV